MKIISENSGTFMLRISIKEKQTHIEFNPNNKSLNFCDNNSLTKILKRNEYQFRKVLHIKRPESYYPGFELSFALTEGKDVAAFNDLSNIVVMDKRNGKNEIFVTAEGKKNIYEIYIDGSYLKEKNKGGYAVILKSPKGEYILNTFDTKETSSSLIELLAAIRGLEITKTIEEVRIVTDSQYVRKGLTEWVINWKLNDWHTASGEKVKNINHWKKFDMLSNNRYIEFKYVKAHSDQFENTMADLYAKDMAGK